MFEEIGSAISAFGRAAASGQVSIEAEAAEDALARISKVREELTALAHQGSGSAVEVRLGANPVGLAMAGKSTGRYNGDDSFLAALRLLREETDRAERALRQSIDNYVHIDTAHAAGYRRGR